MTDVLITSKIAGGRPGQILPLDARLQKHVDAGNARILPNSHDGWEGEQATEHARPQILQATGTSAEPAPLEHGDEGYADDDTFEELD